MHPCQRGRDFLAQTLSRRQGANKWSADNFARNRVLVRRLALSLYARQRGSIFAIQALDQFAHRWQVVDAADPLAG